VIAATSLEAQLIKKAGASNLTSYFKQFPEVCINKATGESIEPGSAATMVREFRPQPWLSENIIEHTTARIDRRDRLNNVMNLTLSDASGKAP
jgi:hypothetical protein